MKGSKVGAILIGGAALMVLFIGVTMVLPMFGIGGDQRESWYVDFDIHPSGKEIVFSSAKGDIFTFDLESQKVTNLLTSDGVESSPHYSPDGKWIVFRRLFDRSDGNQICRMSADGGNIQNLTDGNGANDDECSISPDGKTVYFFRASLYRSYSMGGMTWDDYDLCSVPAAGGAVKQLTHPKYRSGANINILPGQKVAIFDAQLPDKGTVGAAYRLDLTDPKAKAIDLSKGLRSGDSKSAWVSDVSLSSDGKHLAFISDVERRFYFDVLVSDTSGDNAAPRHVTSVAKLNARPVFEPRSLDILYLAGTDTNSHARPIYSLYRSGADGKLTEIAGVDLFQKPETYRSK